MNKKTLYYRMKDVAAELASIARESEGISTDEIDRCECITTPGQMRGAIDCLDRISIAWGLTRFVPVDESVVI